MLSNFEIRKKPQRCLRVNIKSILLLLLSNRTSKTRKVEMARKPKNPDKVRNRKKMTKHRTPTQPPTKMKKKRRRKKTQNLYSQPNRRKWQANSTKVLFHLFRLMLIKYMRHFIYTKIDTVKTCISLTHITRVHNSSPQIITFNKRA